MVRSSLLNIGATFSRKYLGSSLLAYSLKPFSASSFLYDANMQSPTILMTISKVEPSSGVAYGVASGTVGRTGVGVTTGVAVGAGCVGTGVKVVVGTGVSVGTGVGVSVGSGEGEGVSVGGNVGTSVGTSVGVAVLSRASEGVNSGVSLPAVLTTPPSVKVASAGLLRASEGNSEVKTTRLSPDFLLFTLQAPVNAIKTVRDRAVKII